MASQVDEMMWDDDLLGAVATSKLYGDLMIQVLLRLLVKSILRFKSVCKVWYFLFSSLAFIQHQSRISSSSAERTNMLSLLVHIHGCHDTIFSLILKHSRGDPVMEKFDVPFRDNNLHNIYVVGSINGLVCLSLCNIGSSIVLWNPAIRKYLLIPNPNLRVRPFGYVSLGFAYDEKADSYKVVRILTIYKRYSTVPPVVQAEIYSTATKNWRVMGIDDLPSPNMDLDRGGVVVGGVPYWFSPKIGSNFEKLIWFDPLTEAFRFQPLPSDDWRFLEAMGEHPVLFGCKYHQSLNSMSTSTCVKSVDIWKLIKSDEGGKSPFHIEKDQKVTFKTGPYLVNIAGFGRNGEIIAECGD